LFQNLIKDGEKGIIFANKKEKPPPDLPEGRRRKVRREE